MKDREVRVVYHEPDGVRHLSEDLRGIGGYRSRPTTPEDGVEPGLVHRVHRHTHIVGLVLPGEEKNAGQDRQKADFAFAILFFRHNKDVRQHEGKKSQLNL